MVWMQTPVKVDCDWIAKMTLSEVENPRSQQSFPASPTKVNSSDALHRYHPMT
jgi:hypothetical protein